MAPLVLLLLLLGAARAVVTTNVPTTCVPGDGDAHFLYASRPARCPCLMRHQLRRDVYDPHGARVDFLLVPAAAFDQWKSQYFLPTPEYLHNYSTLGVAAGASDGRYDGGHVEVNVDGDFVLAVRARSQIIPDCDTQISLVFEQRPPPCPTQMEMERAEHRVVGGRAASDELVKVAAIVSSRRGDCSAAVIAPQWLITAAHCKIVPGAKAQVGGHDSDVGATHTVVEVRTHPHFHTNKTSGLASSDIAVLRITPPLPRDSGVYLNGDDRVGRSGWARAAGYGRIAEGWAGRSGQPRLLHSVDLPVTTTAECVTAFEKGKAPMVAGDVDEKRHICAGYVDARCRGDTCGGDSGGPLVTRTDGGRLLLIGVTSGGLGCARPGIPGVYVRVSTYARWIVNATDGNATIWPGEPRGGGGPPTVPRWVVIAVSVTLGALLLGTLLSWVWCCTARHGGSEQTEFDGVAKDVPDAAPAPEITASGLLRRWLRRPSSATTSTSSATAADADGPGVEA